MQEAGLERIVRAEDVAHMGLTEVLRHALYIHSQYRRLVASIEHRRPDVAILIDFPDVNLRLARKLKKLGIPVLYFVSPQLWAWKRRRLRWVQQRVSRMLVIFPFEEPFYRTRGVAAQFVGHPLAYLSAPTCTREEFAAIYGLDPARQWIALLPGSRRREVELHLHVMLEAAAILGAHQAYQFVLPVASTVNLALLQPSLEKFAADPSNPSITLVPDARAALLHTRASVVTSGTATVQAAVIGNPFVVVYRVSRLTFAIAKRLVRYAPEIAATKDTHGNLPIAMVNLIAGRRVVPELIQQHFTATGVVAALAPLLGDTPQRTRVIADLAEVRHLLAPGSTSDPIQQVCDAVEALLNEPRDP